MGTWGTGPFDNDTAADWVGDLEEVDDLRLAMSALADVHTDEYVDSDDAAVAIAAAEVIAASGGRPHPDLPPQVAAWVARHGEPPDAEHVDAAAAAVDRVRGDDSELAELWAETDDHGWDEGLDDLLARLGG